MHSSMASCQPPTQVSSLWAPILGRWSDRYGRRRILLPSQAGTLVSWLVFGAALYLPVTELVSLETAVTGWPLPHRRKGASQHFGQEGSRLRSREPGRAA